MYAHEYFVIERLWCEENIPNTKGRRWRTFAFALNEFFFEDGADAVMFKVMWG